MLERANARNNNSYSLRMTFYILSSEGARNIAGEIACRKLAPWRDLHCRWRVSERVACVRCESLVDRPSKHNISYYVKTKNKKTSLMNLDG